MIIELHILQNFAPANLNRDDTGSPKDCEFGGHRRARISSQCFKKAIRDYFKANPALLGGGLALRSKRLHERLHELVTDLSADKQVTIKNLNHSIEAILATFGIYLVEEQQKAESGDTKEASVWVSKSEVLAFLGADTLAEVARTIVLNKEAVEKAGEIFSKYRSDKRAK